MQLDSLRILHLRKGSQTPQSQKPWVELIGKVIPQAFYLDSCQRQLWVCLNEQVDESIEILETVPGLQIFEGTEAYAFLLRVATGLESQIVGETDIFGQLKDAWKQYRKSSSAVNGVMQRIFEDTKDIRSRYMQNLGGASYGSLVRMLLKDRSGPTLLVGAGQIARAVAPYLTDGELWLSNRNAENLETLYSELLARQSTLIRKIPEHEEARAWKEALNVIVCIPFDENADRVRVEARLGRTAGCVIHLGELGEQLNEWKKLHSFYSLDDLFALQKSQDDSRVAQVMQAGRACQEKAKLRSMGASLTLAHGWEDLAVFA